MPRRKLSEYRAKKIICSALHEDYIGWSVTDGRGVESIDGYDSYVVKVDQAIKGRFKKGLVLLDVPHLGLGVAIGKLRKKGFTSFLIEPYMTHEAADERYISICQDREGIKVSYSEKGGVNIESHAESISTVLVKSVKDYTVIADATGFSVGQLKAILTVFKHGHFVFLEINPYVIGEQVAILDCAIEVDDAGMYFTDMWSEEDFRMSRTTLLSEAERIVQALDANSPASFNLSVLNPDGSIFLLLSGGGASVVIADEVYNRSLGSLLANYGEYSGNPNAHETYIYTAEVLKLLIGSSASNKVLFVGGAVANFTDIAKTFTGVIMAIDEFADSLTEQNVKIFVRRGGPQQEIGLSKIRTALEAHKLFGGVYDPSVSISSALDEALKGFVK